MRSLHKKQDKRTFLFNLTMPAVIAGLSLPVIVLADNLEIIHVTAHRIEQNVNDIPASVSVIDQEDLKLLQAYSLSDLFRYEPAVNVERSGSRHGDGNINIRGIGGNRVLLVQDGVWMPSGFGSAGVDQGRGSLNALNLERIEILKGPASALYGSDAIGGVVLFETLNAERLVTENNGRSYIRLSTGYVSDEERYHTGVTAASALGSGYGLLQVDHQRFSELDVNSDYDPNPKDGEVDSVLAKWSFNTESGHHWDFSGDFWQQSVDNELRSNLGPIAGPPGEVISSSAATDDSKRWRLGVHNILERTFGLDFLHWQLDYQESGYEQHENELQENPGSVFPPIPVSAKRTREHEHFEQKQWSFSLRGQRSFDNHKLVSGIDWLQKDFSRPVDLTTFDEVNNTQSKTKSGVNYPGKTFPDTETEQIGIYLQDHWSLSNQLQVLAGVRYDYYKSRPEVDAAYNNFNVSGESVEARSDSHWSPHLGLTYQLSDNQQLYGSYQTGFRAPPVDDQFISRAILIPVPGVPHEVVPNTDLDPETSKGYELGWRWNSATWAASIAYYDTNYEDFIDSRTIGFRAQPPVFVGPTSIRQIQFQNVDEVEINGVEITTSLNLNSWLDMSWQGRVFLGVNVIDAENTGNGQGLNSVGPDTAILSVDFTRPQNDLGISWYIRAADDADDAEPLTRHGQTLAAYEPPGYSVHDISLFWSPLKELRIDAAIYNLFDKKYWAAHTKGADAGGNLDAQVDPGRNFAINLFYSF